MRGSSKVANASGKSSGAPRRLGSQQPVSSKSPKASASSGAQRRQARARKGSSSKRMGWIAVTLVVVVIGGLIIYEVTSGSSNTPTADPSGRNPIAAPAAMVQPVTNVPGSVFDGVGTGGQAAMFVVTKNQPSLSQSGKPRFVYVGGEYCPYCAAMRWSLVAALSRFGTFKNLKESASGPSDGDIPTFSFLGASYSSPYVQFTPYEQTDRLGALLTPVPADVQKLYTTYDGTQSGPTIFSTGGAGIPFLDIANRYVSAGDPPYLSSFFNNDTGPLVNGGPGAIAIAQSVNNPNSVIGKAIGASGFIVAANYIAAAVCNVDGQMPRAVCTSTAVTAAKGVLAKATPIG